MEPAKNIAYYKTMYRGLKLRLAETVAKAVTLDATIASLKAELKETKTPGMPIDKLIEKSLDYTKRIQLPENAAEFIIYVHINQPCFKQLPECSESWRSQFVEQRSMAIKSLALTLKYHEQELHLKRETLPEAVEAVEKHYKQDIKPLDDVLNKAIAADLKAMANGWKYDPAKDASAKASIASLGLKPLSNEPTK